MTSECRNVLKAIRKLSQDTSCELSAINTRICKVHSPKTDFVDLPEYAGELNAILNYMLEIGYIKSERFGFSLTYKGLHPYKVSWEQIKRFLLVSVFVPISVSLVTSLLTLWLTARL